MRSTPMLPLSAVLALATGCLSIADEAELDLVESCEPWAVPAPALDILLVIDNSSSMAGRQEAVSRDIPALLNALQKQGVTLIRAGAITTSVYENFWDGQLASYHEADEPGMLKRVPLDLPDGGLDRFRGPQRIVDSDDPLMAAKLSRLVLQGTYGSGQTTPFEAVRLALTERRELNRPGDPVLVLVVTDKDDCSEAHRPVQVLMGPDALRGYCEEQQGSLTAVSEYYELLGQASSQLTWATLGPVGRASQLPEPVQEPETLPDGGSATLTRNRDCPTSRGVGRRLAQMQQHFAGSPGHLSSVCADSFAETFAALANDLAPTLHVNRAEVPSVPDPRALEIEITRADAGTAVCTLANGGLRSYRPAPTGHAFVEFGGVCQREVSDVGMRARLYCLD